MTLLSFIVPGYSSSHAGMSGRRELEAAVHICDQEKGKMNLLVLGALSPLYSTLDPNPENCATHFLGFSHQSTAPRQPQTCPLFGPPNLDTIVDTLFPGDY